MGELNSQGHQIRWTTYLSKRISKILKKASAKEVPFAGKNSWRSVFLRQIVLEWLDLKDYGKDDNENDH